MWWNKHFAEKRHDLVHHPTGMAVWGARCLFLHGWDTTMAGRGVSRRALAAHVHACWFCQTQCGPRDVLNKVWPCQSNFSPSFLHICCYFLARETLFQPEKRSRLTTFDLWLLNYRSHFFSRRTIPKCFCRWSPGLCVRGAGPPWHGRM